MKARAWLPALLAAVLGAGYVMFSPAGNLTPREDDAVYWQMASNIRDGKGLQYEGYYSLRPPGYPAFLAAASWVTNASPLKVRLIQVLLLALSCLLLYRAGLLMFEEKTAFAACLIYALSYDAFTMPAQLLSECLFSLFLILGVYLAALAVKTPGTARFHALEGAALGLACLVRQEAAIVLLALLAFRFFYGRAVLARTALIPLLCFTLVIGVWGARNWKVHGKFFIGTTYSYRHLLAANWGVFDRMGYDFSSIGLNYFELDNVLGIKDEFKKEEKRKEWTGQMFSMVRPASLLKAQLIKFGSFFYPFLPDYDITYMLALPFIFIGLFRNFGRLKELYPLYAVLLMTVAVVTLFHGVPRYRSSITHVLALFAASGLALTLKRERPVYRAFPAAWAALNVLVLFYSEPVRLFVKKLL